MKKTFYLFLLFLSSLSGQSEFTIEYSNWLKDVSVNTDQTSGITFIERTSDGKAFFLLADDIGDVYSLTVDEAESYNLRKYIFSEQVSAFLDKLPKKDFEEITYDRYTGEVFLSIEGNFPNPKSSVGIFRVIFKDNDLRSGEITALEPVRFTPEELWLQYVENNIGFEGICVDEKYFYLGLEGFQKGRFFADSSLLYIADKISHKIERVISTKELGIGSICGLYAEGGGILWVLDRNAAKILKIDTRTEKPRLITEYIIISRIPGYPDQGYVMALEAITIDDKGYIYCVDDPWRTFYIPAQEILDSLDPLTVDNFRKYIPIIYKLRQNH